VPDYRDGQDKPSHDVVGTAASFALLHRTRVGDDVEYGKNALVQPDGVLYRGVSHVWGKRIGRQTVRNFILGSPKNTMSNLKLINMRRSSNRLGSSRQDGSLRGQPRRAQHIDQAAASIAPAGILRRRRAYSFDKVQANCGCTDLPKGRGLFG